MENLYTRIFNSLPSKNEIKKTISHFSKREYFVFWGLVIILFFQAEDGIRDWSVTGVQTCALPISSRRRHTRLVSDWSSDVCSSDRSEDHPPDLQSLTNLVSRLLLGVQTCALPIDRKSTRLNSSH